MDQSHQGAARYSYSNGSSGFAARLRELAFLIRTKTAQSQQSHARVAVQHFRETEQRVRLTTGLELKNLRALEIGPGQQLANLHCLAVQNEATGIDLDVLAGRYGLSELGELLRRNPPMRALKTIGRKAIGIDRRFHAALAAELGHGRLAQPQLLRMSATRMTFPDRTFQFVYSHSVFEHIDDPGAAMREVARVLRPGGVAYISVHLYASHSGSHDLRAMLAKPTAPFWPHLSEKTAKTVHPNCYLNRLRLTEWYQLFAEYLPGSKFIVEHDEEPAIREALTEVRKRGELPEYTDEELLTVNLVGIWRRPRAVQVTSEGCALRPDESWVSRSGT